jgi:hypothetical protein
MRKGRLLAIGTPNEIREIGGDNHLETAFLNLAARAGIAGEAAS